MKIQKKYALKIIAILICAFAMNILTTGITKTYSAFHDSKNVRVKAEVLTENQMFNVDIVYKVWEKVNGVDKWVPYSSRVMGENITYNPEMPITNPIQIIVTPTSNNKTSRENNPQIIFFEVQENLQKYMLHINPVRFNGERAETYININTRNYQYAYLKNQSNKYTTGYLKIKYLNGIIDKSINIQFDNSELAGRNMSAVDREWYQITP